MFPSAKLCFDYRHTLPRRYEAKDGFMPRRLSIFALLLPLTLLTSCSDLKIGTTYLSEMEHDDGRFFSPSEDFPVMAGDSGQNWLSEKERRLRTPASAERMEEDRKTKILKAELRGLESLQSEESVKFYEKYKLGLPTTSEKIYFLKLPPSERREYLITKGIISETKPAFTERERMRAIDNQDIALGMSKQDVIMSWGRPVRVEVAGNPRYENERWLYRNTNRNSTKYIYFESGQVQGWD